MIPLHSFKHEQFSNNVHQHKKFEWGTHRNGRVQYIVHTCWLQQYGHIGCQLPFLFYAPLFTAFYRHVQVLKHHLVTGVIYLCTPPFRALLFFFMLFRVEKHTVRMLGRSYLQAQLISRGVTKIFELRRYCVIVDCKKAILYKKKKKK